MRSLLFVPADDSRKVAKALATSADALILDLEDSVPAGGKAAARQACADVLRASGASNKLFVRINALDTVEALEDLAAVVQAKPYGIVVPKCAHGDTLRELSCYLSALEARDRTEVGQTRILPIVTEVGSAMFALGSYAAPPIPRLCGMLWGGEDLAADIGATRNRHPEGQYAFPYQLAAIHPDQIDPINRAFSPTTEEVAWARQVVAAFARAPDAGTTSIGGKMLDGPHLRNAQRVLARVDGGSI